MTDADVGRSPMPLHGTRRGLLALSLTGVLWGSIGIVVRLLQDRGATTQSIAFWRFVCATAVLLVIVRPSGLRAGLVELRRPTRLVLVSLGSLGFQLAYFFAVHDVGVATATLISLGLAPVALTAAQAVLTRSLPPTRTLVVLAIALVGLALVTAAGGGHSVVVAPHPARGIVESVVCALLYAASTGGSAALTARLAPLAITLGTSLLGLVLLLPVVAVSGWQVPSSPTDLTGILWLGVVTTVIAYGLFYGSLRSTPAHVAMIVTLLEPVTAVVLAAVALGEPLTLANTAGGVLLLGAIYLLHLPTRTPVPG